MKNFDQLSIADKRFFIQAGSAVGKERKIFEIALARAVAYSVTVPTTPTENPSEYFQDQILNGALGVVYQINERVVIDVAFVETMLRKCWLARYTQLHPGFLFGEENYGIRLFLGVAEIFSKDEADFIADNSVAIAKQYNSIYSVTRV